MCVYVSQRLVDKLKETVRRRYQEKGHATVSIPFASQLSVCSISGVFLQKCVGSRVRALSLPLTRMRFSLVRPYSNISVYHFEQIFASYTILIPLNYIQCSIRANYKVQYYLVFPRIIIWNQLSPSAAYQTKYTLYTLALLWAHFVKNFIQFDFQF